MFENCFEFFRQIKGIELSIHGSLHIISKISIYITIKQKMSLVLDLTAIAQLTQSFMNLQPGIPTGLYTEG